MNHTSSYFGGSRFNDNMFDSYDSTYAVSMWAVGFKLKDIRTGKNLTHEFQIMYQGEPQMIRFFSLRTIFYSMRTKGCWKSISIPNIKL
ncbi:hypothetical protein [Desulfobacter postgatei]|uniref:hypothetical protein n=1 Tax=Desulfobacter postgatei TaxID=2293 RepID=UPI002A363DBC|nr:hypothetical protein [Desulfobacter postgatei]MDX9963675.1 hypothetical protein [Desulfobacter postgatei]